MLITIEADIERKAKHKLSAWTMQTKMQFFNRCEANGLYFQFAVGCEDIADFYSLWNATTPPEFDGYDIYCPVSVYGYGVALCLNQMDSETCNGVLDCINGADEQHCGGMY